ncbi:hypothetical protein GIB67_025479 [Kingdonia uniflora]|uniref:Uncharacterized protein n=1 Tax=Kingdonia uniflora TaxID=39325 RepID=A0A7J7PD75_9MAGN|nr:hypothetical protein GIB67_025479 [Kingdonia uniflora]
MAKLKLWSFYKALIVEFIATLLFLYITAATMIGHKKSTNPCVVVLKFWVCLGFWWDDFCSCISGNNLNLESLLQLLVSFGFP